MRIFGKEVYNYALYGALFGLCFPIFGTLIQSSHLGTGFGIEGFIATQRSTPLLWIIDTAPLFLGLFASLGGYYMDKLKERNRHLHDDFQEMERLRDLADTANKAKSDFLANMSHEIRTPMNGIIGLNHLLSKTEMTPKQQDYNVKVDRSARSLLRIVNDLLDFSKIEAGKLELEAMPYSTQEMLEAVVDTVNARLSGKKDVEFIIDRSANLPAELIGDELRIKQVLINLLDNAIKFTEKGEVILSIVAVKRGPEHCAVTFSVKDQGIGMSPAQIADLFKPFSQADLSHTRKYGGTGLGLTISDRLIHKMGGKILVESGTGKGSRFFFTIGQEVRGRRGTDALRLPFKDKVRALLVDDSSIARTVQGAMLKEMGFDVITVGSGREAVEAVRTSMMEARPFALIIMDWMMPEMSGLEAARYLKEEFLSDAPMVLMVTAFGVDDVRTAAQVGQIDGYLVKPVDPSLLFDTLNGIFKFDLEGVRKTTREHLDMDQVRGLLDGKQILLAEDNEINWQVASELLQDAGVKLDHAENGEEAVRMFAEKKYDGVLMDIQMPLMDGLEATRRIRALPGGNTVPIMAMTAHSMKGEREKSLAAGMNDHLNKPIDPILLYKSLMHWLCETTESEVSAMLVSGPAADSQDEIRIAGLDTATALTRIRNNRGTYTELLELFVSKWSKAPAEFPELLRAGDLETLRGSVHTLAGSAGNLGGDGVLTAAKRVEQALTDGAGPDDAELNDHMANLCIELCGTLESISGYLKAEVREAAVPEPTTALDEEDLRTAVRDVLRLLEDHDARSLKAVEELVLATADTSRKQMFERAHEQVKNWEFDQALNTLSEVVP
ncbi:MAG: response regulator [Flavobacteriales bacterium]|nr:response regulator [Flavobacteriales bacterium]